MTEYSWAGQSVQVDDSFYCTDKAVERFQYCIALAEKKHGFEHILSVPKIHVFM
jgi:hypothetical protein